MLAAGIAAAAGCQFNPSGQPGGGRDGGDPGGPDATVSPIDANPGQPDANCAWPFEPEHFEPCGPGKPPPLLIPLVLNVSGVYTYNTDTRVFTNPVGVAIVPPPQTQENGAEAIWAQGVTIESSSTLRVEGTKALMIISTADIVVRGIIDVSSAWVSETKSFDTGAGSEPSDCSATAPETGGDCNDGGGGGGGGGFSGAGGAGGRGADERNCDDEELGSPGGAGGRRLTSPQAKIRGGCAGARGGNGDAVAKYGLGGVGGGAVHLVSQTLIDIEGSIHAGGAAGAGAEDRRSGGGGGGSGGFIGLEAPDVEIDQNAILAANGGGGGGGTDNNLRPSGQDGQLSDDPATGGAGHAGGNGGTGGAADSATGLPGGGGDRGGGGGGGGVGFIIVYQATPTIAPGATISPAYTDQ